MSWKQRFLDSRKAPEKIRPFDEDLFDRYDKMSFLQEIGDSFKLYFRNFLKLIAIFFGITAIISVITTLIFTNFNWNVYANIQTFYSLYGSNSTNWSDTAVSEAVSLYDQQLMIQIPQIFISFLPMTLSGLISAKFLIQRAKNKDISLKTSASAVFSPGHTRTTILFLLLSTGLFALGISFLFIPGIIFMMLLGFSFFKNSEERKGIGGIMKDGYGHGRNFRTKTFILTTIGIAFFYFAGTYLMKLLIWFYTPDAYVSWLNPETRNWPLLLYYEIMYNGSTAIFQPLLFCFFAIQFVEIGVKNETLAEIKLAKTASESSESIIPPFSEAVDSEGKKIDKKNMAHVIRSQGKEPRFYCPSCGRRLLPTKKQTTVKCGNCGAEVHIILDK